MNGYKILDGATGTNLHKAGMPAGCCPEKWILDNPNALINLQKAYIAAGAEIIYAPTFGTNASILDNYGFSDKTVELNKSLVALSKQAAEGSNCKIAGDLSVTGLMLHPYGDDDFEKAVDIFRQQADALFKAGVDLFVVETAISLIEALAAVTAIKEVCTLPIIVTFTINDSGKTLAGDDPVAAYFTLRARGINAFGINCSGNTQTVIDAVTALNKYSDIPIVAKPNAGLPHSVEGHIAFDLSPTAFGALGAELYRCGADFLGGCCGTTPEHIAELKAALSKEIRNKKENVTVDCAASSRKIYELKKYTNIEQIVCDDDLMLNVPEPETADYCRIFIPDKESECFLTEAKTFIDLPLMLDASDAETLEYVLRRYDGIAVSDPDSKIPKDKIKELSLRYGIKII